MTKMNRVSRILAIAKNIFIAIALLGTLPSYGQDGCWEDRFLAGNEGCSTFEYDCEWCGRRTTKLPYCSRRCQIAAERAAESDKSWIESVKETISQWRESVRQKMSEWKKERDEKRQRDEEEELYKYVYSSDNNYCHVWCKGQGTVDDKNIDVDLYVRYMDSEGVTVFVDFGIKLFSDSPVSAVCRCGGNNWHHDAWGSSTSGTATFYHGKTVDLVNEMRLCSRYEMSVKAANGSSCSASFEGVGEKVQQFVDYYNAKIK